VVPFMEYLRDQSAVEESAGLLVAWLDLLTGMASGEEGASTVFGSLLTKNAGKLVVLCIKLGVDNSRVWIPSHQACGALSVSLGC